MPECIALTMALLIPTLSGWAVINYVVGTARWPLALTIAVSYAVGIALVPFTILVLDACGMEWNLLSIYAGIILIGVGFVFGKCRMFASKASVLKEESENYLIPDTEHSTIYHRLAFIGIFIYIIGHMLIIYWRSLNQPVFVWDAMSTSMFKAKIFFYGRDLSQLQHVPRPSYPLHIPLLATWISMNLQEWNDQLIKIIFPLNFTAFLVIQYYFLRCFVEKAWSMLGIALILSSEYCVSFAPVAYRELTLVLYNCGTIFWLLLWNRYSKGYLLILAGIFSGIGTFTKLEGNGYFLIHIILLLMILYRKKISWFQKMGEGLKFCLVAITPVLFYLYYKMTHNVIAAERSGFDFVMSEFYRIPLTLKALMKFTFFSGHWHILWGVLLISLINVYNKKQHRETLLMLVCIPIFLGLLFGVIAFTENYDLIIGYYEKVNVPRLLLHFFPLVTTSIILLNFSNCSAKSN